jgi:hypothetical protein
MRIFWLFLAAAAEAETCKHCAGAIRGTEDGVGHYKRTATRITRIGACAN